MHITTEEPKIILVGNKNDLADQREVDYQEAEAYAKQNDLLFIECSAYHNTNIESLFNLIINQCQQMSPIQNNSIVINKQEDKTNCCFI